MIAGALADGEDVRLLGFGTFGTCCVRRVSPATRAQEKICPWRLRTCTSSSRVRRSGRPWAAEPHDPPTKEETGQRQTAGGSLLNPRACDTMTSAFVGSSRRHREYKQKADLGSLSAPGPVGATEPAEMKTKGGKDAGERRTAYRSRSSSIALESPQPLACRLVQWLFGDDGIDQATAETVAVGSWSEAKPEEASRS